MEHPTHHTITGHHSRLLSPGPKLTGVLVSLSTLSWKEATSTDWLGQPGNLEDKEWGSEGLLKTVVPPICQLSTLAELLRCPEFTPMDSLTSGLRQCPEVLQCGAGNNCPVQRHRRGQSRKSTTFLLSLGL